MAPPKAQPGVPTRVAVVRRLAGLLAMGAGLVFALSEAAMADGFSELKQQVDELQQQNRVLQTRVEEQQREAAKQQDELQQQRVLTERLMEQVASLERRAPSKPEPSADQPANVASSKSTRSSSHRLDPLHEAATSYLQSLAPVGEPPIISNLNFRVFPSMSVAYKKTGSEDNSTFRFEENSFMVTAEAMDRVDFLLEGNYFFSPSANTIGFTLQRLTMGYALSDLLNLRFGRMHPPLGYWNEAFHHGGWVSTTIERPEIYRFDFDSAGGYLPTHSVGMDLSGRANLGTVDVEYVAGVLNGRGRTASEVAIAQDKNDSKALSLLLKLSPHAVEGLTFGSLVYWDTIPPNPSSARRIDSINEVIIGAHAVYFHEPFTLLTEWFTVHHDDHTSNLNFDTRGLYVQGEYRLTDRLKPYYRYDWVDVANGDPFFTGDAAIDRTRHTAGLRWDPFPWNAVKLEYSFVNHGAAEDEHEVSLNSSFVF